MKLLYTLAIGALISTGLHAQEARGYLGKKNVITYNPGLKFNGFLARSMDTEVEEGSPMLYVQNAVTFQRCISRQWTALVRVSYAASTIKPIRDIAYSHPDLNNSYGSFYYRGPADERNSSFNATQFEIGMRRYTGITAPVGYYWGFSGSYTLLSSTQNLSNYGYYDYGSSLDGYPMTTSTEDQLTNSTLGFHLEFGVTRIIKDKWVLEYGLDFGINTPADSENYWTGYTSWEESFYDDNYTNYEDYKEAPTNFLRAGHQANTFALIRLGIGMVM